MLELIEKGGVMMVPIIISSILAFAVTLDRLYFFLFVYSSPGKETVNGLVELVEKGDATSAVKQIDRIKTALKSYYISILSEPSPVEREHTAEKAGNAILFDLSKRLNILTVVGSITPLLGLLGTVLGMIRVFYRIAQAGSVADISVLAGGIWEALITTAAGMMVAIPAIILHHIFKRWFNSIAHEMQLNGERLINGLDKAGVVR